MILQLDDNYRIVSDEHNFGHNWPIRVIRLSHKSFKINHALVAQHG